MAIFRVVTKTTNERSVSFTIEADQINTGNVALQLLDEKRNPVFIAPYESLIACVRVDRLTKA